MAKIGSSQQKLMQSPAFLTGGGEMGARMRAVDWAATSLGDVHSWPVPLQITLRTLLTSRHPMFLFWGQEHICFYNDAYARSLGPEQHPSLLGSQARKSWAEIWPIVGPQLEQVMSGGEATWHENQLVPLTRHGQLEQVYWTYSYGPVYDPVAPHNVGGVLVVCSETTHRVQEERALRLAEKRWRTLFDQAPGFMCVLEGPDHRFTYANTRYLELVQRGDVVGRTVNELFPELRTQMFNELLDNVYQSGEAYVATAAPLELVDSATGRKKQRYLDFIYQPIHDAANRVTGIFVEGADVTDRVNHERTIRISEERLNLAIEAAGLALLHIDLEHDRVIFSREFRVLVDWGDEPEPEIGLLIDFFHPDDREHLRDIYQLARQDISDLRIDTTARILRSNGEIRWVRMQSRTIVTYGLTGPVPSEIIGTFMDITNEREVQHSLQEARRLAEVANETKSAFLANMSHEIRTPMSAVLGYADLLAMKENDAEQADYLRIIRRNGQFLLDIIDDILDISKIEAGKLDIQMLEFSIGEFIADLQSMMSFRAAGKGLDFDVIFTTPIPEHIRTDPQRLKQILVNLIGNAVKFTETGAVKLLVDFRAGNPSRLRFSVMDTGVGMSTEQQERLFQPFSQGDESINRTFGGTGLGLAISQRLARLLGSEIQVTSSPGEGSCFSFDIATYDVGEHMLVAPCSYQGNDEPLTESESIRLDALVMVVDDRADVRHLVMQFLQHAGASVVTSNDGVEAISRVKAMFEGTEPVADLILLDMKMPRLDGYHCATQLRLTGFNGPIIALTADAMQSDMTLCLRSGCDAFLSKPVDAKALLRTVAHYLRKQGAGSRIVTANRLDADAQTQQAKQAQQEQQEQQEQQHEPARPRVLIVDDAADLTRLYQRLLSQKGFDAMTAADGCSALALAEMHQPDIVLLDIGLPDMSGIDLIRTMKALPGLERARFIALSGHAAAEDERASLSAGFDHHLVKPVSLEALMAVLRRPDGQLINS